MSVTNSTISGNSASFGGGIVTYFGSVSVTSSTIYKNSAGDDGGGIFFVVNGSYGAHLDIASSIIAGNMAAGTGNDIVRDPDDTPDVNNSLIGDSSGTGITSANGNLLDVDPKLGPLAFNGGPTQTHALLPGSPAIDNGSDEGQSTDQRGFPRPFGDDVDIGAFELQNVFTVNEDGDEADMNMGDGVCDTDAMSGQQCTLRAAIEQANASLNDHDAPDTIYFQIPGIEVHTITPLSPLPAITEAVIIDATSQSGFAGTPVIEIDGFGAGPGVNGLYLDGAASTGSAIRGLAINNFQSAAIRFDRTSGGHTISGNVLGLDVDGSTMASNRFGLHVSSANNTIEGNVISGNNRGILLNGGGADNNTVRANLIGTNAGGNASLGNNTDGVKIRGGSDNTIGGPSEADGNTISANVTGAGVAIYGGSANNNTVQHNLIGTKSTGDGNRGNNVGINLLGAPGNTIKDNVVAGSKRQAVRLIKPDTTGTLVENNLIGLDLSGTSAIGTKYDGIQIANARGNTVRGNVIANSGFNGIRILNAFSTGNIVQGNLIGTAQDGTTPMGNSLAGVLIKNAPGNQIGGTGPGEGNTISANGEHGILIERPGATGNIIEGNHIGTQKGGTAPLGNVSHGIQIADGTGNVIGGTDLGAGNVIGGNGGAGIAVTGGSATIQGNFMGTDAGGTLDLGNTSDGIIVNGGVATIGGAAAGAGNVIAHNGNNGVKINSGTSNAIRGNSIHDNAALGIDLKPNGVTANDPGDSDTGANNLQNFPILTSAVSSGGNTTIQGSLNSIGSSTFTVEFFSSPAADPSGNGEGETFVGSAMVSTDPSGDFSFMPSFMVSVPVDDVITATATDANGNTSEFSAPVVVMPRPVEDVRMP